MKRLKYNYLFICCLSLCFLVGCSKDDPGAGTDSTEAIVQVELSFSENYASYSWLMGFQLISSSSDVTVSGHSWDETTRPEEFATWLTATEEGIMSGRYWMETTAEVSAVTFNGTAELLDGAGNTEPLTVTAKVYADGKLIKTGSAVFESTTLNYLTVIVSSEDF